MDTRDVKAEFSGFGPIPSSRTTFAQGIGLGGSFAPIWTTEPKLPERRQTISNPIPEAVTYPFHLTVASVTVGTTQVSKIRIQYGEIDGVPPNGMTQGDDYLLDPGNSFIYLIVTFDGDGRINSRTIGFANPVPDDTDDIKHIVIGEVAYGGGVYTIVNQNIAQDIYPEKAVVVDRSNGSFVYSLFADPRKINAIYELENFNVNLNGSSKTTQLYIKSQDNKEYIELKKDSTNGECSVYGYVDDDSTSFLLKSDVDGSQVTVTNSDGSYVSVLGTPEIYISKSDGSNATYEANQLTITHAGTGDQTYISTSAVDITSSAGHGVYAGNQLTIVDDATSNQSYLSTSALHITTTAGDSGTYEPSQLTLHKSNGDESFFSSSELTINNDGEVGTYLQHEKLTLGLVNLLPNTPLCELEVDKLKFSGTASNPQDATYGLTGVLIHFISSNSTLNINDPGNGTEQRDATWQEIDICVDGTPKKMKVLGTAPY